MASISNIAINNRSMNEIIILSNRYATIENGNIVTDGNISTSNTTISNITTDDINLNLGGGRSVSVFDDLKNKATYTDIQYLSGIIYNYYNSLINYKNINNNNTNIMSNEITTLLSTVYTNYNNNAYTI